jgi:2-C-methyl-D-erythritol 4-phosphate cytidylyltransferase
VTPVAVHALIPAAGRSERMGGALPKQLRTVAGRPLVAWAVARLRAAGVDSIVVAAAPELLEETAAAVAAEAAVQVVAGGATRQASVALALRSSRAAAGDWLVIHDGARAVVHPEDVAATIAAAREGDGAVLGRPLTDTLKSVEDGRVVRTVDRSHLFRAETPQVFRRGLLERALEQAAADRFVGTDESSLVERLPGLRIAAVAARHPNPKVTFEADLARVESLLATVATTEPGP